jgi:quercetin dioxygenase-like cupin family protein
MPLTARLDQVQERFAPENKLLTQCAYGHSGGIMQAERPGGYHSRPHVHPCEQYNYVVAGELWLYILDEQGRRLAFRMREGDLSRVPTMAVHWSQNLTSEPIKMIEFHLPGLQDDPKHRNMDFPLFDSAELRSVSGSPRNLYVDPTTIPVAEIEDLSYRGESSPLGYLRESASVPAVVISGSDGTAMRAQVTYGQAASMIVTEYDPGFRSQPQFRDSEQLSVLLDGSLTVSVLGPTAEAQVVELHQGDFWRVPPMSISWVWNRSADTARLIQLHAPGLQYEQAFAQGAVSLLAYDESPPPVPRSPRSYAVDPSRYPVAEAVGTVTATA